MRLLNRFRTLIVIAGIFCAAFAQAYTITVNTPVDEDMVGGAGCSLREAITLRNLNVGGTYNDCTASPGFVANEAVTINFSSDYVSGGAGVVEVHGSAGLGVLNVLGGALGPLTVTGIGHTVHISCNFPQATKIFVEATGATFTLSNVLMDGCTVGALGVAINNSAGGNLTISNVTFDAFHSNNGAGGGAVVHYGDQGGVLTISNSSFTNNIADQVATVDSGDGGALYISSLTGAAPSTLTNVTFTSNVAGDNGGALYYGNPSASPYALIIDGSTFTSNIANGHTSNVANLGGGAIYEDQDGTAPSAKFLIKDTLFTGNTAPNGSGGAIFLFSGRLAYDETAPTVDFNTGGIYGCHFTGNSSSGNFATADAFGGAGGAIYSRGYITVSQSSFVNNNSNFASGGAIATNDSVTGFTSVINNVTFYNNSANENGGAIANLSASENLQLVNDTIANNSASGVASPAGAHPGGAVYNANASGTSISARNTIFGASSGVGGNCTGTVPNNVSNNLQYSPDTGCGTMTVGDPLLSAPAVNAPATGSAIHALVRTMAIGESSPASRGGDPATCIASPVNSTDATGAVGVRPFPLATPCDVGAYESGSTTPVELQSFSVD